MTTQATALNRELHQLFTNTAEGKPIAMLKEKPASKQALFNGLLKAAIPTVAKFLKLEKTEMAYDQAPDKGLIERFAEKLKTVSRELTQKPMPGHGNF